MLRTDDYVDVWLISWATEQAAESMSYYSAAPGGHLRRTRSVLVDAGSSEGAG